jgi:agmatinase
MPELTSKNDSLIQGWRRVNFKKGKRKMKYCEFCLDKSLEREKSEILILGIPFEGSVNSRGGSSAGPEAIREASDCIESYSPFFEKDLADLKIYDDGNIMVKGKGKQALEAAAGAVWKRISKGVKPVFLGGDHSISYAAVKALVSKGHEFELLHLDAHTDSQDEFSGDSWSYASWVRRSREFFHGNIYQLGVRTGTKEDLEYASKAHKLFLAPQFVEGLRWVSEKTKGKNLYVSIDIDVMDPSLAPGTSNPVYGGLNADQIQALFYALKKTNVIGMDLVEVAPNLDPSGRTAILAAEIIRDGILAWWG